MTSEGPPPDPEAVPDGNDGFVRVHPVSPLIRGGLLVLAVLGYVVSQQIDTIVGALSHVQDGGEGGRGFSWIQAGIALVVVLGAVLLGVLSWWFTRYRLGTESLEMRTGVIFRQHRQVRYDRIQAVDLVRPLLARLTGVAEVRVESAGGGDSHVSIAYLRHRDADAVRQQLLGLAGAAPDPQPRAAPATSTASSTDPVRTDPARTDPGRPDPARTEPDAPRGQPLVPVLSLPTARLLASVLLSWEAIFLGVFLVAAVILTFFDLTAVVGGFVPVVVVNGGRALMRLTRWYGLTLALREDTLTSERGLTDTRTSSVPLHRVQAVAIEQPLLWRRAGWWSLTVNIAGARLGSASGSDTESVLVPVATTREVLHLLEGVTADPETTAEVASLVDTTPTGFTGQPRTARWLHPLAWRRTGYLPGRRAVMTRSGWAKHRVQVVPWGRIQSLTLDQGIVARRLGLASVHLVSTVGPISPEVKHLREADAQSLIQLAGARSSHARRRSSGPVGCDPTPDTVDWAR